LAASGAITLRGPDLYDDLEQDELATSASNRQNQAQMQKQSQATVAVNFDVETRTKEIEQIAQSIAELAELFRDLNNMVVEQGTVLDSVEYNVQVTARETEAAVGELKIAQRYVHDKQASVPSRGWKYGYKR
jgi:syntaxin 16